MPVYMIRAGEHGPVKIGHSDNIPLRMVKMQADNHERLRLVRSLVGGEEVECELHGKFAHHHLHGEWFSFSRKMLGDLGHKEYPDHEEDAVGSGGASLSLVAFTSLEGINLGPLQCIINALGGDKRVADALECGLPAVSNWKVRGIPKGRG